MELFPTQPDLSLQISPPNSESSSHDNNDNSNFIRSLHHHHPYYCPSSYYDYYPREEEEGESRSTRGSQDQLGLLIPITRVPLYHPLQIPRQQHSSSLLADVNNCRRTSPIDNSLYNQGGGGGGEGLTSSRRFRGGKRTMRAPRMRWTSTLHNRFVYAVNLLGGHESNYLYIYADAASSFCFNFPPDLNLYPIFQIYHLFDLSLSLSAFSLFPFYPPLDLSFL